MLEIHYAQLLTFHLVGHWGETSSAHQPIRVVSQQSFIMVSAARKFLGVSQPALRQGIQYE
ncbi:MAG: hypothetical protein COS62_03000 [Zetaproteobacteria bacterium CG03_land_8_20_14_0_80_59_51]|nr:MAG: hypothetical protein COX56_05005 [Zetaproteobacteria bacterium CG23_combo_of_CG06-09_8_20_14_all_59_86]PIU97574.1 MAG: hypothetical protein COS62_03000 [Zetaproteobacteria bacterium CG03_land_8_20_14_0_80_59_51]HCS13223.1 hypothetical protein [Zetaproteobacteria bacterium]